MNLGLVSWYWLAFVSGVLCGVTWGQALVARFNRKVEAQQRAKKAEFDAEILSRWIQLDVIRRDARERGYEFVDKRAKS